MSNWNLPAITSGYLDFVTEMNDKFVDAGTIGYGAPTNLPDHAMRFNRSLNIFEELVSGAWQPKIIGVAGGGTGATDPATIRVNLGLGSMAVQNSNAVNITGGSITGVNFDANNITGGILALARGGTGASLALGAVGTVMLSNGSGVVFAPGTSITELNAGALVAGTVPVARLTGVGKLAEVNTWIGNNYFNSGLWVIPYVSITADYPQLHLTSNVAPANHKRMILMNYNADFYIQLQNDDGSPRANVFSISGTTGILNGNGAGLLTLNGSNITTGTVAAARLGSGAAHAGTFLRGDNVWAEVTGGGSGGTPIPPGLIAMFDVACPVGWTRYAAMDNRFPLGHPNVGLTGGSNSHGHAFGGSTDSAGTHRHYFRRDMSVGFSTGDNIPNPANFSYDGGGASRPITDWHHHSGNMNFTVDGETDDNGAHAHNYNGGTDQRDHTPPYFTLVFCRKD